MFMDNNAYLDTAFSTNCYQSLQASHQRCSVAPTYCGEIGSVPSTTNYASYTGFSSGGFTTSGVGYQYNRTQTATNGTRVTGYSQLYVASSIYNDGWLFDYVISAKGAVGYAYTSTYMYQIRN